MFILHIIKGGRCDGSEEKPFEINCIEDLVAFSQNVNTGNNYSGKYIKLMRTLDFSSIFSYNDYTTTEWGDLNKVSEMSAMFYGCEKLEELDFSNFNTKNVRTMNGMFRQCYSLKSLDLSNFDMTNVTRTDYMFYYCPKLEKVYVDQNWNEHTNITTSTNMFGICPKLIGAINYDSSKVDITYANYNTGYFTYKAIE